MTFMYPWVLGVGAVLAACMVLWHILRPKSRVHVVPSLMLWRNLLQESQSYRPIHPPHPWWLLLLRLLIVIMMTCAAAGPIAVADDAPKHVIIVIDTSASMATTYDDGQRIDVARTIAQQLVARAPSGSDFSVVRVDADVEILASRESDRIRVSQIIDTVHAQPVAGNLATIGAWMTALAGRNSQVTVLSDDVRLAEYAWPSEWRRVALGGPVQNDAIDDVAVQQLPDGWNVRVRVRRYGALHATERLIEVRDKDGQLLGANVLRFSDDIQVIWEFMLDEAVDVLQLRLNADGNDGLASDDVLYWQASNDQPITVAVQSDDTRFVPAALAILPNVQVVTDVTSADVLIASAQSIPQEPTKPLWLINAQLPDATTVAYPQLSTMQLSGIESRVNRDVELTSTQILTATNLAVPLWGQRWLTSTSGTHAFLGSHNGVPTVVFGFDMRESDLVLRPEFPLLVRNVLEYLTPATRQSSWQTGQSVPLGQPDTPIEIRVAPPQSRARIEQVGGQYFLIDATMPGLYELTTRTLVINLQSRVESDVVRPTMQSFDSGTVATVWGLTWSQGLSFVALLLLAGERLIALHQRRVT